MKTRIGILTATRAEYGLLKPLIVALTSNENFDVKVLVTGAHLSSEYGFTCNEILEDGINIDKKIEILSNIDSPYGVSVTMSNALLKFAEYFDNNELEGLIVLGDRYETLAVCCAAMNARIPIIHLHGGEITEGAIDEAIRHSISKMSFLHFTSNEVHRKRVIQLGESPERVFNVGAIGVENVLKLNLLSKQELEKSLDVQLNSKYAVVTFHPVTLERISVENQFLELQNAINAFPNMKFIFTKSNADAGGNEINSLIDELDKNYENIFSYNSLGVLKYLSALKYCSVVIGNSSSGIIEAPSFKIPTVNIGDRQKGRMQADSVINCKCKNEEIINAIEISQIKEFRDKLINVKNPYGDGDTTYKIVKILESFYKKYNFSLMKKFFDVNFNYE